ncbi:MAG: AI-2E family transporter [Blautia sp.]
MNWKKAGMKAGVVAGVFLSMKYLVPVMLPFIFGWLLALLVRPAGKWTALKCSGRKICVKQSIVETTAVFLLSAGFVLCLMWGLRELSGQTGKIFAFCLKIKEESMGIIGECCRKAERVTGVSAASSSRYIYEQMGNIQEKIWNMKNPAEIAKDSLKICITAVGGLILTVVSAVLFIQEQELWEKVLNRWEFSAKLKTLLNTTGKGIVSYIKAQVKIMGITAVICVGGFCLMGIRHFVLYGVVLGLLDAFPVLGTGTFLIPAAIILAIKGNTGLAAGCTGVYLAASGIRQFLEPRLIGKKIGVSPLLVLLSVYLGVFVYGWQGVVLGPLSAFLIYGIFREWSL